MKKFLAVLVSMVFAAALFTGCKKDKEENIDQAEMAYGATMRQIVDGPIDLLFDGRFLTDEEMNKLSDYFYSIQTHDASLFESTQPKHYMDLLTENSGKSVEDYINDLGDEDVDAMGEDYVFESIEVTDVGNGSGDINIGEIEKMLDGLYSDNGEKKSFTDGLKDAKFAKINITAHPADDDEKEYQYTDKLVYIFTCEDGIYIIN